LLPNNSEDSSYSRKQTSHQPQESSPFGHINTVPQKYLLTRVTYRGTVIAIGRMNMANVLPIAKRVSAISALAEGSGIRQGERMTGVLRRTIPRNPSMSRCCTSGLSRPH
jgi:hypothetical protein